METYMPILRMIVDEEELKDSENKTVEEKLKDKIIECKKLEDKIIELEKKVKELDDRLFEIEMKFE